MGDQKSICANDIDVELLEAKNMLERFADLYSVYIDNDISVRDHLVAAICVYLRDYHGGETDDLIPTGLRAVCK